MRYKSEKINQIMQTEAGDFSIKFFRYRSTTSQRASARWLVVERYLKNLIEKSPASVCLESSNYSFPDLYLISLCRVTFHSNKHFNLVMLSQLKHCIRI